MVLCVKVQRGEAQKLKNFLLDEGLLDRGFRPEEKGGFVFFPVKKEVAGHSVVERKLRQVKRKPNSLKEALGPVLKEKEIELLTTSFDLLGELAIVEIPKGLERKKGEIGKAVMLVHPSVRTVAAKKGPMEGEFRVRKLEVIAGRRKTETLYKESGCSFLLDPAKVYFSPRLSFERERIAGLVGKKEKVLVMFAGVGPFAIVVGKKRPKAEVAAIELNPAAFGYMVRNIELNRMTERVIPVFGDVRDAVPMIFEGWADRVLMPLPKGAEEFLGTALIGAKKGAFVHLYTFARVGQERKRANAIAGMARGFGRKAEVVSYRTVRPFAPHVDQIVVDLKVE